MNDDVVVELIEPDATRQINDAGETISIEHGDGSVTISLDGSPLEPAEDDGKPKDWFRNLVHDLDGNELTRISEELLRGISDDITSRQEWIEDRTTGIKLLGLKIETPNVQGASDGAPVEGMSKVRHPLLLEAVLRFQANARSELLPTDGPLKIRNDDNNATVQEDRLADCLQKDLNHYLTTVATEYYPDTDRMLLMLGFGGSSFKKVYFCPLRNRPVSESVDASDLIVDNAATDLKNAKRVTHRVMMRPSTVKRLQILGVYRDIDLSTPAPAQLDSLKREAASQQGVNPDSMNPDDRDREIYECYCELDVKGFEHKHKGKVSGLDIPYRVTIDVTSREILSIVRNYPEETQELPEARVTFVKYTFVPGMGFLDIGLLHILGNTTNAVTAAWREMLDNGMFANFPGFLISKAASRQNTNIIRVPPGGGQQIDTQGMKIGDAVMPLPYNTAQMAPLHDLVQEMTATGQRVGGTAEAMVGEGRADVPVGTMMALIEQAQKIMNAVHKRLCTAQAQEFALLMDCFREHPESFMASSGRSKSSGRSEMQWDEQTFLQALDNYELVPQADPNTASHTQRLMKVNALVEGAKTDPGGFNLPVVRRVALEAWGWSNPEQFLNPNPQPDPKAAAAMSQAQTDKQRADADTMRAQADRDETQAKIQSGAFAPTGGLAGAQEAPNPIEAAKLELDRQRLAQDAEEDRSEALNRERDRESNERQAVVDLIKELIQNPQGEAVVRRFLSPEFMHTLESNEPSVIAQEPPSE